MFFPTTRGNEGSWAWCILLWRNTRCISADVNINLQTSHWTEATPVSGEGDSYMDSFSWPPSYMDYTFASDQVLSLDPNCCFLETCLVLPKALFMSCSNFFRKSLCVWWDLQFIPCMPHRRKSFCILLFLILIDWHSSLAISRPGADPVNG